MSEWGCLRSGGLLVEDFELFKARFSLMILEMRGSMTQREFSLLLGVSQSAIQMWESGGSLPSLDNLARVASFRKQTTEALVAYLFARPLESQATTAMEQVDQMTMLELSRLNEAISHRMLALISK